MAKKRKKGAAKGGKKVAVSAKKSAGGKKAASPKRTVTKAVRKPAKRAIPRKVAAASAKTFSPVASSVIEDYLAIQQLLSKYCHVADHGSLDEIVALFHRDAVLLPRHETEERYEGRAAVRSWYERWIANVRANVRYLRHKITAPVIEVSGNEATAVCYLDMDAIPTSTNRPMLFLGRYEDRLIKAEGRWWFKERTISVFYTSALAIYSEGWGGGPPSTSLSSTQSRHLR
ncbi:MAG: nuclear transport factor 2 family protein [Candidatus Binatia bacterium]